MTALLTTYGLPTLISAAIAYLLGSISFAIPVTRIFINQDIRELGSHNAGFTNVLRCVGKPAGIITFIGDFAKGICSVFIGEYIFEIMCSDVANISETAKVGAAIAGLFALLGHLYPLYFGFKGGKGVLISAGLICALDWKCFLPLVVIFLIVFAFTRTVSKGSLAVSVAYPIITFIINKFVYQSDAWLAMTLIACVFAIVVIYKHKANIQRIIAGTEPKTTIKKSDSLEHSENDDIPEVAEGSKNDVETADTDDSDKNTREETQQ